MLYCPGRTPVIPGVQRSRWGGVTGEGKSALSTSFLLGLVSFGSLRRLRGLDTWGREMF